MRAEGDRAARAELERAELERRAELAAPRTVERPAVMPVPYQPAPTVTTAPAYVPPRLTTSALSRLGAFVGGAPPLTAGMSTLDRAPAPYAGATTRPGQLAGAPKIAPLSEVGPAQLMSTTADGKFTDPACPDGCVGLGACGVQVASGTRGGLLVGGFVGLLVGGIAGYAIARFLR